MNLSPLTQFYLKNPITPLHVQIDRYAAELLAGEFAELSCRRFFCVPMRQALSAQVDARRYRNDPRRTELMRQCKIAVLLTTRDSYLPIGALLLVTEQSSYAQLLAVKTTLESCRICVVVANEKNYKEEVRKLLSLSLNQARGGSEGRPLLAREEPVFSRKMKQWMPVQDVVRVIPQVGLSEVIGTIRLDEERRAKLGAEPHTDTSPLARSSNPRDIAEFEALGRHPEGVAAQRNILSHFASHSSFDFEVLWRDGPGDPGSSEAGWWPAAALELDGKVHRTPDKMFRDHKKNRLCEKAGLPLIRVDVTMLPKGMDDSAAVQSQVSVETYWEYFEALLTACMQPHREHIEKMGRRLRGMEYGFRLQELVNEGKEIGQARQQARQETRVSDQKDDEWDMSVRSYMEEQQELQDREDCLRYKRLYGAEPDFQVHIDEQDVLQGRLGKWVFPPLKPFCRPVVGLNDVNAFRLRFARDWLLRKAFSAATRP